MQTPFDWERAPRSAFDLGKEMGVYALFLRENATFPIVAVETPRLLYIGKASGRRGLVGRCHFNARTANHSPRKSLAVLLMTQLQLTPILVSKPNSTDTWGLDVASDAKLSEWMHENLELAIEICDDPDHRETELVSRYAPPLNLAKCEQSEQHRMISAARAEIMRRLTAVAAT